MLLGGHSDRTFLMALILGPWSGSSRSPSNSCRCDWESTSGSGAVADVLGIGSATGITMHGKDGAQPVLGSRRADDVMRASRHKKGPPLPAGPEWQAEVLRYPPT